MCATIPQANTHRANPWRIGRRVRSRLLVSARINRHTASRQLANSPPDDGPPSFCPGQRANDRSQPCRHAGLEDAVDMNKPPVIASAGRSGVKARTGPAACGPISPQPSAGRTRMHRRREGGFARKCGLDGDDVAGGGRRLKRRFKRSPRFHIDGPRNPLLNKTGKHGVSLWIAAESEQPEVQNEADQGKAKGAQFPRAMPDWALSHHPPLQNRTLARLLRGPASSHLLRSIGLARTGSIFPSAPRSPDAVDWETGGSPHMTDALAGASKSERATE